MTQINDYEKFIVYDLQKRIFMFQWTAPKKKNWWERFRDQPHQLFFASTIFFAILLMGLSMKIMISNSGDFSLIHGFGLEYAIFTNAFLGFLLTVIPKYTQSVLIKEHDYIAVWAIFEVGLIITFFVSEIFGKAFVASALLFTFVIFAQTINQARIKNQIESLWLSLLVLVASLVVFSSLFFDTELIHASLWFFIFPLVFTVAQRMIPAFFAVYFKENVKEKPIWFLPVFIFPFWIIGFFGVSHVVASMASLFLFFASITFLLKTSIYRKSIPILWILAVGLSWLPVGFLAIFFESFTQNYTLQLGVHILTLGFVFTLLIGFGTRVILGHSGQKIETDKISVTLFYATQVILITRILASVFHSIQTTAWIGMVHLSFVLWIILFLVWGVKFSDVVLRLKK